ncbi:inorganic anion transporter, SulP family, partial [Ostertagia ostertagi]
MNSGGFAVLSLMTHTAIEKVMMKTAISYNATSYVNHTIEELDTAMDGFNGTNILGNGTSLIEEITTEMWTDGVSPVKEIHVATTIIFFAGCIQLTCLFSSLALVLVILYIGPALEYLPQCILSTMIIVSQRAMFAKFSELRELWPVFKVDFLTCLFSSLAGLVLVILYIGPALEYLPQCILSTMIIVSQRAMFAKFSELRELWPVFKVDFTIWLMSMVLTVCFDMGEGLLLATGFAVLTTIIRMQ